MVCNRSQPMFFIKGQRVKVFGLGNQWSFPQLLSSAPASQKWTDYRQTTGCDCVSNTTIFMVTEF